MKFLILGLLAAIFSSSYCSRPPSCFNRKELKDLKKMRENEDCSDPTEMFVHLAVPNGTEYLMPSTVKVKRCNGYCWKMKRDCLPLEKRMISVKVEAMKMHHHMARDCTEVEVEEHISCGCNCKVNEESCTEKQVFNDKLCSCMCKGGMEAECKPGQMFDQKDCECLDPGLGLDQK